jgi:hypothetical protein
MNRLSTDSLRWAQRERDRHKALIGLAVVASALIAAAPHNERRMFTISDIPSAFAAIPAPEPTSLRSAIMGYLHDGCAPTLTSASGDLSQLINRADCGPARERSQGASPLVQKPKPLVEPAAYFAAPEFRPPVPMDASPLVITAPALTPPTLNFSPPPIIGGGGFFPGIPIPLPGGGGIPPVFGTVPEPSTWALMIGGFGLVGGLLRRRRELASVSYS